MLTKINIARINDTGFWTKQWVLFQSDKIMLAGDCEECL